MNIPKIKLNNSIEIPVIGFGTCKHSYDKPIDSIIEKAMETGYRYFDTASFYETERDLGKAIKSSGLERKDLTIATKLWYEELGYQNAKDAFKRSLERLDLDYIDLYFIHWPKASEDDPKWKETIIKTWKAMLELKEEGLIRALGVSNFLPHHLQVLFDNFDTRPVIDQLELHLGYFQEYAVSFLKNNNIQAQAWSPLGRGKENFTVNKILNDMAKKYDVSVQKLSLRFLYQRGVITLPWAKDPVHMASNLDIFDFKISDEDISMLSCMPDQTWLGEHPDFYLPKGKHVNLNQ